MEYYKSIGVVEGVKASDACKKLQDLGYICRISKDLKPNYVCTKSKDHIFPPVTCSDMIEFKTSDNDLIANIEVSPIFCLGGF